VRALKAAGATNADDAVQAGVAALKDAKATLAALEAAANPQAEKQTPPAPKKKPQQQQKKGGGGGQKSGGGKNAKAAESTSSAEEVRAIRIEKIDALTAADMTPFAYRFDRTHTSTQLQAMHSSVENGVEVEGVTEAVCGRVKARRVFGKLAFLSIEDDGGAIQVRSIHWSPYDRVRVVNADP